MTWDRQEELKQHPPSKPYCTRYPQEDNSLWKAMDDYLIVRGSYPDTAHANGWYPTRSVDGWGRVVVPCSSSQPSNLYWQARLLDPPQPPRSSVDKRLSIQTGLGMPRRWESPHGVSRGDAVCVVWPAQKPHPSSPLRQAVVAEGPMDALAAAACGYIGVGLLSATPSEECLSWTRTVLCGIMTLTVMDLGAEDQMIFNAGWLREHGVPCRLVNPYPHKDLAAWPRDTIQSFLETQWTRSPRKLRASN